MTQNIDVYVATPGGPGWAPVHAMAELLSTYVTGNYEEIDARKSLKITTKLIATLPRFKAGKRMAIVIASDPGQLNAIAQAHLLFSRYTAIYGWVIDSFWDDRIPRIAKATTTYTTIFVTDPDDKKAWEAQGVRNVVVLPWGTDVWSTIDDRLRFADAKTTDLLRVGRQPLAWDNDAHTADRADEHRLIFRGRPGFGDSVSESISILNTELSLAKSVLAFSVRASPTSYTHPTKDYITARWLDALAWGAVVVGQRPDSAATEELLWEGATLDLSPTDVDAGLSTLRNALPTFTQENAKANVLSALERLDWRHRFKTMLDCMGTHSPRLESDLLAAQDRVDAERTSLNEKKK